MFLSAVNYVWRGLALAALLAPGWSANAQQAIQFSKPANQDPAAAANSALRLKHSSPADFKAPSSLFGDTGADAGFDELPGGPPVIYPNANNQQWQKMLQERKNWALSTPEQILQVPTPETILGLTDPREDPNLSPEERFLKRQDRLSGISATNGPRGLNGMSSRTFDPNRDLYASPDERSRSGDARSGFDAGSFSSGPPKMQSVFTSLDSGTSPDQNLKVDPTWTSPFGSPEPQPKPTPKQLEGMEAFRALMESPTKAKPSTFGNLGLPAVAAPDPNLQALPVFNRAGSSFTPLANDIKKISPLAGVTGPPPAPPKKSPLVSPPPWMSSSLQNPTLPQRQY